MTLFFESDGQAGIFLINVVLGFVLAFLLHIPNKNGLLRFAADIFTLLIAAFCIVFMMLFEHESALRGYQLLGLCIGAILYMAGLGKLSAAVYQRKREQPFCGKAGISMGKKEPLHKQR